MELIKHKIQKKDTLDSIAEKYKITINELKDFHNQHCGITQKIIDVLPAHLEFVFLESKVEESKEKVSEKFTERQLKYRCEQNVFTYINKVPVSNATTKRDYLVELKILEEKLFVKVKLLDNILEVNPNTYAEAANIIAQLDVIKCNDVILQVNETDGSILRIVNHSEIIKGWEKKRAEFEQNSVTLDSQAKKEVKNFINLIDDQILNEENLIDDYKGKMFFDIYFNKFLANSPDKLDSYQTVFRSQLFEGQKTDISIRQDVLDQNGDLLTVRKVSETLSKDTQRAKELYDLRYKPMIGYQFSSYETSYRERSSYNEKENYLEEMDVTIMEQIKNNLELRIHYTVRKIE